MQNIVMGDEMVQQGIARKKYQNMVFSILGNQKKSLTVEEQGEYVYQYCKIYLEAKGINSKEININAIYVLSRNVMLGFYGCLLWCGLIFLVNFIFAWEGNASIPSFFSTCLNMGNASNCILVEVVIALLCLIKVFRRRCIQYSEYRVKVVLREYYYHTRRDQAQA